LTSYKNTNSFEKDQISAKLFLSSIIFHNCAQVNLSKCTFFGKKRFHHYFPALDPHFSPAGYELLLNNYDETITFNQMNKPTSGIRCNVAEQQLDQQSHIPGVGILFC